MESDGVYTTRHEVSHRRVARQGAQQKWALAEALCADLQRESSSEQRFRPPRPERRPCQRFQSASGCPFGDECTHLHLSADGVTDERDQLAKQQQEQQQQQQQQQQQAPGGAASPFSCSVLPPRVYFHKMEDRKVGKGSISLLIQTLKTGGFRSDPTDNPAEADLLLANAFPSPPLLSKLRPGCTVNHFPGEHELCAKDRLAKLLRGLFLIPDTFILPEESEALKKAVASRGPELRWIVKPCQLGEGRHIRVLPGLDGIMASGILGQRCVVSEYIADPLLVDMRKIDLRVYVLVTKLAPVLEAFIFREGLVRFCGEAYDLSETGLQKLGAHISNNAVQTKTTRHASAKNWKLQELWDWLDANTDIKSSVVWQRILRVVHESLRAWRPLALASSRRIQGLDSIRCYSLLAFDLLVDSCGAVWLLEVNPKPALHAQSPSLKAIFPVHFSVKAGLLADLFSLVGLPESNGGSPPCIAQGDKLGFQSLNCSAPISAALSALPLYWSLLTEMLGSHDASVKSFAAAGPCWREAHCRTLRVEMQRLELRQVCLPVKLRVNLRMDAVLLRECPSASVSWAHEGFSSCQE
ncbi:unnamed protein product [Polarella glacialis]|uniref:C3H1-type domain-containing protein n=1 Tax=Polarella glacialis TaxID=89957 RepID=A0A813GCW7_POLGL|nr:unnamed protein product [Polarella glacialis]